jgi:hypothetical protein
MPQIPNLPIDLRGEHGVQMIPPPAEIMGQTQTLIRDAIANIKPGKNGAFTLWIEHERGGQKEVNAAFVTRIGDDLNFVTWVGSKWGTPTAAGVSAGAGIDWQF